nr:AAA family ATPase [Ruminococcus sp. YE78]
MTTLYQPTVFAVEGLLTQGLFILAGSPKVGKSWLALELCLSIAKGEKLLDRTTQQGSALYFCLEDSYQRIQNRLYELTDEPSDKLFFSLKADTIGNGLEEQITKFKLEHSDLCLIVIDTLQMVRNELDSSYGSDYAELLPLKALAEQLNISIVLVHHLRKATDSDPFNMISGSTGLNGCVDGLFMIDHTSNYTAEKGIYADVTKTEKSTRLVDLPPAVCDLLRVYKHDQDAYKMNLGDKWQEHDRLFTKWDGQPMHPNTPYTWLMRECKRRDFPFYGIHTFRHFVASAEIEAGIDPTTVAAMLGHSTPAF